MIILLTSMTKDRKNFNKISHKKSTNMQNIFSLTRQNNFHHPTQRRKSYTRKMCTACAL